MNKHMDVSLKNGSVMRVQAITPFVFRARLRPDNHFQEPGLVRYGIIRNDWPDVECKTSEKNNHFSASTEQASFKVNIDDGNFVFCGKNGRVLIETAAPPCSSLPSGFNAEFKLQDGERLFGLGDETRKCLQKRGHKGMLWVVNCASYFPIPFLMSSRGWALFLNTTWRNFFDLGHDQPDRMRFWADGGELDFYLIAGQNFAELLDRYTDITGKPALMPIWQYGLSFMATKDADARAMLQDCVNFRRDGFPCDNIGLEPTWMSKSYDQSTEKTWHPDRFRIPYWQAKNLNPSTFIGAAKQMGFKFYLWLCCDYDLSWYEEYLATGKWPKRGRDDEFMKQFEGMFDDPNMQPGKALSDQITKPEQPWFEHLKKFVDQGADGFMLDGCAHVAEHPDRKWGNGMDDEEMHNLYPVLLVKQMHQGFKAHTGRRIFLYCPDGYAGFQRFSASWAGDTGAGPNALMSILNHGMSGHSNTSFDINLQTPAGIHFGLLHAWADLNAWITWEHPSYLGDRLGVIARDYLRLRYRLMPYIYSMAHIAFRTGMPIVRAMPLIYPDDSKWDNCLNQYFFGDAFLVSVHTDSISLPTGRWIDFWTGDSHEGPQNIIGGIPENRGGHLFVRAGAIIPSWPEMDYVGQKSVDTLELHIYPGADGQKNSFTLYEDDGISFNYLNGAVAETLISCGVQKRELLITVSPRKDSYAGMPETRKFVVKVHRSEPPGTVMINGHQIEQSDTSSGWNYDTAEHVIRLQITEDVKREKDVVVNLF